ncbi:MAG: orotidine-5'-phosphate decarboxylase [Anaerolineae bacterium]
MTSFCARLEARTRQIGSLLCVGLDPHPADLPAPTAAAARDFCLHLIEATADLAAAFKPKAAFFEAFGSDGIAALRDVIAAVPDGIPVVLDAKRGDIASTAEAYARAAFETLGADAITLSPYLGRDSLTPFLADPARGVFLLCKTSNLGAGDLQDLPLADRFPPQRLFERVAELARGWNENDNLGLVVGATHPEALAAVRRIAPDLWILAPGVGAQGGDLAAALRAGLCADGLGLLLPVSRQISRAADPRQAAEALVAAMRCKPEPNARRAPRIEPSGGFVDDLSDRPKPRSQGVPALSPPAAALADRLLEAGCVRFGQFTLKSGLQSPIHLDLRRLVSDPPLLAEVGATYVSLLRGLQFDRLAALPYAALPIATAISLQAGWPLIYPRKEAKSYGTAAQIEGAFMPGERVVVIDDLATTGGSKFEAIAKLAAAGLHIADVLVLIDRCSGAAEALAMAGYRLHAVVTLPQMLDHWAQTDSVPAEQLAATWAFLGMKPHG